MIEKLVTKFKDVMPLQIVINFKIDLWGWA